MKGSNALVILTALTVAGGCAGGSSPTTMTNPPITTAVRTPPTKAAPSSPATPWATAPITVSHQPPISTLPVLTRVRYAAHKDGFDRVVLDIPGALPGYSARYVREVRRDGSDELVSMPGEAFLLIVLHPAQAHREDGTPTVTGTHRIGLAGIKAYAIVGDYEGYVSIALGVNGVQRYHIGELTNRIYIDVAV